MSSLIRWIFFVFIIAISSVSVGKELVINDPRVVDTVGLAGLKDKKHLIDASRAGIWFLQREYPERWSAVKDNEFELMRLTKKIADDFFKQINKYSQEYLNNKAVFVLRLRTEFGKYDFSRKAFPLKLANENSYVCLDGDKLVCKFIRWLVCPKLTFDNTNEFSSELPMNPDNAEKFLMKRRRRYGDFNRELIAVYRFTITKIDESVEPINSCYPQNRCWCLEPKLVGHIVSIEIFDPVENRVIYKVPKIKR